MDGGRFVAKSKEKEARDGGLRMELARKMGLVGFDVLWLGESALGRGEGGSRKQKACNSDKNCNSQEQTKALVVY